MMTARTDMIAISSAELKAVENYNSTDNSDNVQDHDEFGGQRLLDFLLATVLIVLLSPAILLRAALSIFTTGRLLKQQEPDSIIAGSYVQTPPARFNGRLPGAGLASLFSLLSGSYTLVASAPHCPRPGLFSAYTLRQSLGVDYLEEDINVSKQVGWGISEYFRILAKSLLAKIASPVTDVQSGADFNLFGIRVINTTMPELLDECEEVLSTGIQTSIGFVNADCMNKCFTNDDYHQTLRNMNQVYPDGIGVRLASQMFGNGVKDNINGTDLFPLLCERLAGTSHGIFLLGAAEGVAKSTAENMQGSYPGLNISGYQHGFFTPEEEDEVINTINASGASVLMVAMGAPQQEQWIATNRERLNVRILMGVGGLFDFYSGRVSRAPVWIREVGLEWVWRLLQEPGRMWRRYVVGNPLFLYRVWKQKKRNGSVAHMMKTTPAQEAHVLGHFNKINQAASIRPGLLNARRIYWKWARLSAGALKRVFDIVAGTILLIMLSPIFMVIIPLIRMESPGPAFYSQMRVGLRGEMFKLWKFRSMYKDADQRRAALEKENEMTGGVIFKMKKDPRITRLGGFIRKMSIDELPQLWNVIKGDMSLVGPRPALASEVELYSIEERVRLMAKPGLTCIWQVEGRSEIPFPQQVLLDEDYLYRQSLFTDIKLLFQTIPAVIRGKGAY
jgi:exopolysaccharide biosynthesis WecB/TagA/CpsF family protein